MINFLTKKIKKVSKPKLKNSYTKSLLKSAFNDLERELGRLRSKREIYNAKLKKLSASSDNTKVEENKLQDRLNFLRSTEIELNNTKQEIMHHLSEVEIKLDKIKKAKDELSDI